MVVKDDRIYITRINGRILAYSFLPIESLKTVAENVYDRRHDYFVQEALDINEFSSKETIFDRIRFHSTVILKVAVSHLHDNTFFRDNIQEVPSGEKVGRGYVRVSGVWL